MSFAIKHKGLEDYKKERRDRYDLLSFPKWNRIRMKHMSLGQPRPYNHPYNMSEADGDYLFEYEDLNEFGAVLLEDHQLLGKMLNVERDFGVGEKFTTFSEGYANAGFLYYAPKNFVRKQAIEIHYEMNDYNPTIIDHNIIVADAGAKVEIIIHYTDEFLKDEDAYKADYEAANEGDYDFYHVGVTKIFAHRNSQVKVVKLQDFSKHVLHIDNNIAEIEQDAEVIFNTCDLGGHAVVTDYTSYLDGDGSRSESKTAYLGEDNRRLDIGFNIFHQGRHSDSLIETKGALMDRSRKVFRGNLKFYRGAKRATGSETEYVLLLDEGVHSDSIPALLCDEDDVSGEHAASAGQVNEGQMFYLMSRGFSKNEAMKLVIHGNFADFIDSIPIDSYKYYIDDALNRRLVYETK